jgi:hypothetical protein
VSHKLLIVVSALVLLGGAPVGASYVVSGVPASLRLFAAELRRDLAEARSANAGSLMVAQSTDKNPLASVKSLKCRFPVYTVGSWKNGEPKAEVRQAQEFSLEIDEIDTDGGVARVSGTAGPTHVTALLTLSSLHFMERTVTGTLTITTVFASEGAPRKYRAVHSRHDYLPMSLPGFVSEPSVSQNYGECEVPASPAR